MIYSPDPTAAYHGGNPQSKAAHESIRAVKKNRREKLLRYFEEDYLYFSRRDAYGGWTTDELEGETGWTHQGLSPRIVELRKAGAIVPTGETRPTRSGRQARVYRLAEGKP